MSETRGPKYYLDWLQHGYWIGNLLASLGIGRALMNLLTSYVAIGADWRGVVWLLFSAAVFWLITLAVSRLGQKPDKISPPQQESVQLQVVSPRGIGGATAPVDVDAMLRSFYNSTLQADVEANFAEQRSIASDAIQGGSTTLQRGEWSQTEFGL